MARPTAASRACIASGSAAIHRLVSSSTAALVISPPMIASTFVLKATAWPLLTLPSRIALRLPSPAMNMIRLRPPPSLDTLAIFHLCFRRPSCRPMFHLGQFRRVDYEYRA
ncbi:MAG: hypothetical protein ABSB33_11950 [Tepidisphaeraceae bacterium]